MNRVGFWINDNADIGVIVVLAATGVLFLLGSRGDDRWQIRSRPVRSPEGESESERSRRVRLSLTHYGNPYYTANYIALASLFFSALSPAAFFMPRPCSVLLSTFDFGRSLLIGALLLSWLGARVTKQITADSELEIEVAERIYEPLHLRLRALYMRFAIAVFVAGTTLAAVAFNASKGLCS